MTWDSVFNKPYTLRNIYEFRLEFDPSNTEYYLSQIAKIDSGEIENSIYRD